jgi:ATP-dependent RNA helicase DDX27
MLTQVRVKADRLLEMGFTEEVQELVKMCPVKRQTMLFSATMTHDVKQVSRCMRP